MPRQAPRTPGERYAALVELLTEESAATFSPVSEAPGKTFGTSSLKIDKKIFAMLVKDRLVVKLPRNRVDELIVAKVGRRFDPGHGRLMKEWLSVQPAAEPSWVELAREAMRFVGSKNDAAPHEAHVRRDRNAGKQRRERS